MKTIPRRNVNSIAAPPIVANDAAMSRAMPPPKQAQISLERDVKSGLKNTSATRQRLATQKSRHWSRDSVAALVSVVVHTSILLALMVVAIEAQRRPGNQLIISSSVDQRIDNNEEVTLDIPKDDTADSEFDSARELTSATQRSEVNVSSMPSEIGVGQPEVAIAANAKSVSGTVLQQLNSDSATQFFVPASAAFSGFSIDGRGPGKRAELVRANGGSAATEAAVEAAIGWLIQHQYPDGSWSTIQKTHPACGGQCSCDSIERLQPKAVAATGLALLTLLGAGYTHRDGPYQPEIYKALQFLLDTMKVGRPEPRDTRSPGQFVSNASRHMIYEQGIATFALCEAYQMTNDPWLEPGAQRAINFVRAAQNYDGSWGYYPVTPGDLSIVGWQMMALRSATAAGLEVPSTQIRRVNGFLLTQSGDGGSTFGYRSRQSVPEMTGIGGLIKLMLGYSRTDPSIIKGLQSVYYRAPGVQDDGPETTDVYHNYYATNFLFYSQSDLFPLWNERLKQHYLSTQSTTGHEAGSWFATDVGLSQFSGESDRGLNMIGGRLYTTAMAAMTLEVYYRFLPIQKDPTDLDFKL